MILIFLLATCLPLHQAFTPIGLVQSQQLRKASIVQTSPPHVLLSHNPDEIPSNLPILGAETIEKTTTKGSEDHASTQPTPVILDALQKLGIGDKLFRPETAIATAALAVVWMLQAPLPADAAMSGGRMGGSFSSPRSSSMTRSAPSSSSYRSGYSRGYSQGFGSGYYSRPSVTVSPFVSPFYSPFTPRPYFYGGPGIVTYRSGFGGLFPLLFLMPLGLFIMSAVRSASQGINVSRSFDNWSETFGNAVDTPLGTGTSVAQISVALEVPNRDSSSSILSVLDHLADTARTDTRVGIQNLTSQVALELLRRKNSIVSASTSYKHFKNRESAERDFTNLSIKERGKFEQETVSKYGGVDYVRLTTSKSTSDGKATIAVVTIMINIDGDSTKPPKIGSIKDVEEALRMLAADAKVSDCLQGAEILWTPQDRAETLTLRDVVADYPELRSV